MGRLLAISLLLGSALACSAETLIFAVRHAEKSGGPDPGLTERGQTRAEALANLLADAGLTHIFSSDFRRTRQTAAPLASRLGLPVLIYDARDLPALTARLREIDGRALVVGHSNTTPALVTQLGGQPGSPIDDSNEYDRLYIVSIDPGSVGTVLLRYGNLPQAALKENEP